MFEQLLNELTKETESARIVREMAELIKEQNKGEYADCFNNDSQPSK